MVDHVQGKPPHGALAPWSHASMTPGVNGQATNGGSHVVQATSRSSDQSTDLDLRKSDQFGLAAFIETLDKISHSEALDREVDVVMKRLFKAMDGQTDDADQAAKAADDLASRAAIEFHGFGTDDQSRQAAGAGNSDGQGQGEIDPLVAASRERVVARIEAALARLGKLKTKLHDFRDDAYSRIVNINSSVAGLNMAKVRADAGDMGINSASDAYNAIMTNLRTAIAAHGRLTPEIVRLILN